MAARIIFAHKCNHKFDSFAIHQAFVPLILKR